MRTTQYIYVNDLKCLEKYGFKYDDYQKVYDLRGNRTWPLHARVDIQTQRMHLGSADSSTVKVLCEMYKAGEIRFEQKIQKWQIDLSKEEVEIIQRLRAKKGESIK